MHKPCSHFALAWDKSDISSKNILPFFSDWQLFNLAQRKGCKKKTRNRFFFSDSWINWTCVQLAWGVGGNPIIVYSFDGGNRTHASFCFLPTSTARKKAGARTKSREAGCPKVGQAKGGKADVIIYYTRETLWMKQKPKGVVVSSF